MYWPATGNNPPQPNCPVFKSDTNTLLAARMPTQLSLWRKICQLSSMESRLTGPALAVKAPVLNGFGQVLYPDVFGACQVGNGAGYFQDTIISTGR